MPSSFPKGSRSFIFRVPPSPHGSPSRPYQHAAISLGLPGQAHPHPLIISVFPAGLSTGHAPILPWRKERKARLELRNGCSAVCFPEGSLQPKCLLLLPNAGHCARCTVRPNNTKVGIGNRERFIAGPCKMTGGSSLRKHQTP